MEIGIASDHRGYKLKQKLTKYLTRKKYTVIDYGTTSTAKVDYPDYGFKLGEKFIAGEFAVGIAICGTGIGISIACNKVKGVRCAKIDNPREARLAKRHNDANIIAISSDKPFYEVKDIVDAFLKARFLREERHIKRIYKITNYENREFKS